MNKDIKEFFDSIAEDYQHEYTTKIDELLDSIDFTYAKRILDLGSGHGIISNKLYERSGAEIVALDISSKMSEIANKLNNNAHIHIINEDFYQYDESGYDIIVCFDAYPHFMDVDGFVKKAKDLLNINGQLVIIHDIGRIILNEYHANSAGKVSRLLKKPEEEILPFIPYFSPILLEENDEYYKIILKKIKN